MVEAKGEGELFWIQIKEDENLRDIYMDIDQQFEYNIVVLGDPKVGKTSLIQSIINGQSCMNNIRGSAEMYEMLNLHKSVDKEMSKCKLELTSGDKIPVTFYDTRTAHYSSSINQLYRDMHGFIVVCDITNLQTLRDVPNWIREIEQRA